MTTPAETDRTQWQYVQESEFGLVPTGSEQTDYVVDVAAAVNTSAIFISGGCIGFTSQIFPCDVGDCLQMSGWSNSENNIIVCVDEIQDGGKTVCVSPYDPMDELVDEDLGQTITIDCGHFETTQTDVTTKILRWTGDTIAEPGQFTDSLEIREDRRLADVVRTQAHVEGELSFEMSLSSLDDFLEAGICSKDWTPQLAIASSLTNISVNGSGTYTLAGGISNVSKFDWIKISGFANSANNGFFQVTNIAGNNLSTTNSTSVTESSGEQVTIERLASIADSVTLRSFSMERIYYSLKPTVFARYSGMCIDSLELSFKADEVVSAKAGMVGKREITEDSFIGDGSPTQRNNESVMSGADHVVHLRYNGAVLNATEFMVRVNNSLRPRYNIGTVGPASIGLGTFRASGVIRSFFETSTQLNAFLNNTVGTNLVLLLDTDGGNTLTPSNAYLIEIPRFKFVSGKRVAGGQNVDILADLEWRSMRDSTRDYQLRIAKLVKE